MTNRRSPPVVIVGGGVSGLSIAVRLAQAGVPVLVLEASQVGFASSTRNQGWLYSGAWFAPDHPGIARLCHSSLQQTLHFCPECLEPRHEGMAFLVSRPEASVGRWTEAWDRLGIAWRELEVARLFAQIPGLDHSQVHKAFLLPDRSIRTDVLLAALAREAEQAGAEIRTHEYVTGAEQTDSRIGRLITGGGDEIEARLVVLAGGAAGMELLSEFVHEEAGRQSNYTFVPMKTHLVSVSPEVSHLPFCVVDAEGFNHLPHEAASLFGCQRWTPVRTAQDQHAVSEDLRFVWDHIERFFPQFERDGYEILEWASVTVQAIPIDQIEPAAIPLPTVIDHSDEWPSLENLVSVFPGRAGLWTQVADDACRLILAKLEHAPMEAATAPWEVK